jgi:hypothetical protein
MFERADAIFSTLEDEDKEQELVLQRNELAKILGKT